MPWTLTECCKCCKCKHQRNVSHVSGNCYQKSANCCYHVAVFVQLIHSVPFLYDGRSEDQGDNQRNIDKPRKCAEHILICENIFCIVCSNTDHRTIELLQNIGYCDHHIIFVVYENFECFSKTVFGFFCFCFTVCKFFIRKFFYRKSGNCIYNKTDNRINNCDCSPSICTTAHCFNKLECNSLNQEACSKCEDKAIRTHLNSFLAVLCNKSGQSRICDVVCRIKYTVKKSVADKEPCVLSKIIHVHRDCKYTNQGNCTADKTIKHPRFCLAHFRMCLINQRTKNDVCYSIKNLRYSNENANNTCV